MFLATVSELKKAILFATAKFPPLQSTTSSCNYFTTTAVPLPCVILDLKLFRKAIKHYIIVSKLTVIKTRSTNMTERLEGLIYEER